MFSEGFLVSGMYSVLAYTHIENMIYGNNSEHVMLLVSV